MTYHTKPQIMKKLHPGLLFLLPALLCLSQAGCRKEMGIEKIRLLSPSGMLELGFRLDEKGTPLYDLKAGEEAVLKESSMGFEFAGQPAMKNGFRLLDVERDSLDENWEMPWGEQRVVRNHYRGMTVHLQEATNSRRKLDILFRAYDDGVAFRYYFPEQEGVDSVTILEENTCFALASDPTCWWTPGDWDIYEHLYTRSKFSEIDALPKRDHPNLAQTYIPYNAVNTPVTMRTDSGLHLSFHEANLTDYAGMTLRVDTASLVMKSELVGSDRFGWKVRRALPFATPWRTIQVSPDAADLIGSRLILNLNEPNRLGDVSWFKPMKYVGIWWEMHLGKSTWDMASGRHGATTENAKRYIDFAAANGIHGLLVEGWNTGWEQWTDQFDREGIFDFVTPYPDYDLPGVVRYARSKGVRLIMHHETMAAPRTYEHQMDTAYRLMQSLGVQAVKTGYVGRIIPKGEYHHGQWMVNHYRKVLETAARYHIAVDAHEPIKPTGIRRTLPNAISREGLRGQEYNAWSADGGNPPSHLPTVAFTRMLAGPIDFTPGAFNIKLEPWKPNNQVNTTLAQQLALYVVIYSPIQMACDMPEAYEGQPAFRFIREVGVDWEQSRVLNGEVGEYVTIAREERGTGNWFLGSITGDAGRSLDIDFGFLEPGITYLAHIYRDGETAHWDNNPTDIVLEETRLTADSVKRYILAPGGGLAISLFPEK